VELGGAQYEREYPTGYATLQQHVSHESGLKHKCEKTPSLTAYPTLTPTGYRIAD
jgi:hypothetical protein